MNLNKEIAILYEEIERNQQAIKALQMGIDEKKTILAFLESKLDDKEGDIAAATKNLDIGSDLPENPRRKLTMIATVSEVITKHLRGKEFDSSQVMRVLSELGLIPGIDRKIGKRMASILFKLCEKGELERTFKGKGYTPHRYRIIENARDKSGKREVASAATHATLFN